MKSRTISLLVLIVVVATPSIAHANVGTPLMWATILHMFFGNACIGLLEGLLLVRFYRCPAGRACALMILANYFSAWFGWIGLSGLLENRDDLSLYNAGRFVWGTVAAAYLVTLVLEWPFVAACFRSKERSFNRSCEASFLVQSVSYLVLFGWYGLTSVGSMFTQLSVVLPDQLSIPSGYPNLLHR